MNVNKLRGKIIEQGLTIESLAEQMGLNRSTMYRKLRGGAAGFSVKEAALIASVLQLDASELISIFFNCDVARGATKEGYAV